MKNIYLWKAVISVGKGGKIKETVMPEWKICKKKILKKR